MNTRDIPEFLEISKNLKVTCGIDQNGLKLNVPVCMDVDPGNLEGEIRRSSNRNTITSSGEMEQLLLELQRESQHHLPEKADSTSTLV